MADIIPPSPVGGQFGSYQWQDWYFKIRKAINDAASIAWSQITDFTGSNLTSLATRNHSDLQSLQGGIVGEYYHLTNAEHAAVAAGITVVITTAKVTPGGANGSMTFTKGILTAQTQAT